MGIPENQTDVKVNIRSSKINSSHIDPQIDSQRELSNIVTYHHDRSEIVMRGIPINQNVR